MFFYKFADNYFQNTQVIVTHPRLIWRTRVSKVTTYFLRYRLISVSLCSLLPFSSFCIRITKLQTPFSEALVTNLSLSANSKKTISNIANDVTAELCECPRHCLFLPGFLFSGLYLSWVKISSVKGKRELWIKDFTSWYKTLKILSFWIPSTCLDYLANDYVAVCRFRSQWILILPRNLIEAEQKNNPDIQKQARISS